MLKTSVRKYLQQVALVAIPSSFFFKHEGKNKINGFLSQSVWFISTVTGDYDPDYKDVGITYEHMQSVIEDTLVQCGYYDQHKGSDEHRTPHSLSPTWQWQTIYQDEVFW